MKELATFRSPDGHLFDCRWACAEATFSGTGVGGFGWINEAGEVTPTPTGRVSAALRWCVCPIVSIDVMKDLPGIYLRTNF